MNAAGFHPAPLVPRNIAVPATTSPYPTIVWYDLSNPCDMAVCVPVVKLLMPVNDRVDGVAWSMTLDEKKELLLRKRNSSSSSLFQIKDPHPKTVVDRFDASLDEEE